MDATGARCFVVVWNSTNRGRARQPRRTPVPQRPREPTRARTAPMATATNPPPPAALRRPRLARAHNHRPPSPWPAARRRGAMSNPGIMMVGGTGSIRSPIGRRCRPGPPRPARLSSRPPSPSRRNQPTRASRRSPRSRDRPKPSLVPPIFPPLFCPAYCFLLLCNSGRMW